MRARLLWWLATAAALAAGVAVWLGTPIARGPVLCLFRRATELPCPGCGLTRAFTHLARGDLAAAMELHPLAPVLAAGLAVLWGWLGLALHGAVAAPRAERLDRWLLAAAAVMIALWMGRLAVGDLAAVGS